MSVIGITVLIMAALAVVACCAGLLSLRSKTKRFAELQQTSEQQIRQLTSAVLRLEARLAELAKTPVPPAPKAVPVAAPVASPVTAPAIKEEEEITPELLVLMASAVTVFLGKTVRIRSAKRLQSPYEIVNPWSQQGRVFVQASHNLRSR